MEAEFNRKSESKGSTPATSQSTELVSLRLPKRPLNEARNVLKGSNSALQSSRELDEKKIVGCLVGTAVGDSLGLPFEGLSPRRQKKMFPKIDRQQLLFGRGMISDDTQHTIMLAQSLIESKGQLPEFERQFAKRLRKWLLALPPGIGKGTLVSGIKLWLLRSPHKSGVFSAGNGPAMRSSLLGLAFGRDHDKLFEYCRAATTITHTDPKALAGALTVALAAAHSAYAEEVSAKHFMCDLVPLLARSEDPELLPLIEAAVRSVGSRQETPEFAKELGLQNGFTGYMHHTVPLVIHAWLSTPYTYQRAVLQVLRCGGDTDTTAAIVGAICGCRSGIEGIPLEWRENIIDPAMNKSFLPDLAKSFYSSHTEGTALKAPELKAVGVPIRNAMLLGTTVLHALRRFLPHNW